MRLALLLVVAISVWQMSPSRVAAASIQGLFLTFDLLFIIFGAILLLHTLERSGGNRSRAARELGITRQGLSQKLKKYAL